MQQLTAGVDSKRGIEEGKQNDKKGSDGVQ
jgi:hypothetical protein